MRGTNLDKDTALLKKTYCDGSGFVKGRTERLTRTSFEVLLQGGERG